MRIRSARALPRLAAASLVACAHGYRDPDPSVGATARVVIENVVADSHESINASMWASVFHVYEGTAECTKKYLGTISIANPIQEIRVAADRMAVLGLSVFAPETYDTATCKVEVGFVPAAGESYRLIVRDNFHLRCSVDLLNANGEGVQAIDWRNCEPQ